MNKKIKLNCEQCGKALTKRQKQFCSRGCHLSRLSGIQYGENHPNWKEKVKKTCRWCEKEFEVKPSWADLMGFCSRGCAGLWRSENVRGENHPSWKERIKKTCDWCGEEFEVIPSRTDKARFCSRKCKDQGMSERFGGKNHPQWKGGKIKLNCKQCGEEFEGWLYRADERRFCSIKCKGRWMSESLCGENNPFWKGGISFEPYGPNWTEKLKEEVRKRDDYICAMSGEVWQKGQEKFPVHHCDYDKTNNNPDNLITLSKGSHARTNTNRRHWQALLVHVAKGAEMRANAFINLGAAI